LSINNSLHSLQNTDVSEMDRKDSRVDDPKISCLCSLCRLLLGSEVYTKKIRLKRTQLCCYSSPQYSELHAVAVLAYT